MNRVYKLQLLQPKQDVFWHSSYSRSDTINAWKIPVEVKKIVYLHPTYVLSVLIIGLNITCTKFWILWTFTRPTSYLYTISTQNMNSAKWWHTSIAYQHFCQFIRPVRHEEKPSKEKLFIRHAAAWAGSYKFRLSSPGASVYAKKVEFLAAKDGTICREGCSVFFHKWPLSRHLGNWFWISEPV